MKNFIPAARPSIGKMEIKAVKRVMKSGMLAQGPEVAAFESEFSRYVENSRCVAVNSGTSGLLIALIAAGITSGDEVIVPSFTFAATANSVVLAGGTPVFVDINPETFNIEPRAIEAAITSKTKAIMPVHLYGHPCDMNQIMKIADKYQLLVIEDAAQAHLASLDGKRVGSFGIASVFSFYPTKNMTSAEGGMIATTSDQIYKMSKLLRNQGMEKKYENEVVGFNHRMTDLHAAIGREQLKKVETWTEKRIKNAEFLSSNLYGVKTPHVIPGAIHVYHQYTIRVIDQNRDEFVTQLARRGIGSGIYYPIPVHLLPSFKEDKDLLETSRAAAEVLSLPVYPSLKQRELEKIVEAVNEVAASGA